MTDDERDFKDHPDRKGSPLVLMVQPEKRVAACSTCKHVRRATGSLRNNVEFQKCGAVGTYTSVVRTRSTKTLELSDCNLYEPKPPAPPAPPRVGLLRWLWRMLW